MQQCSITVGAHVRLGERTGTVLATYADGQIARVKWEGEWRRGDREVGENPRKRYPYVSDIGTRLLEVKA